MSFVVSILHKYHLNNIWRFDMRLVTSNGVATPRRNSAMDVVYLYRYFLVWFEVLCGYVLSFSSGEFLAHFEVRSR